MMHLPFFHDVSRFLVVATAVACAGGLHAPASAAVDASTVYVSPDGDDTRRGLSPAEAVRSLARVQALLKSKELRIAGDELSIRMMPGIHRNAGVTWDYVAPGRRIVIEPAPGGRGEYPVTVDGTGDPLGQFFLLRIVEPAPAGINTGIVIRGLRISNYCEGISFGDWKSTTQVTGNLVESNEFVRIGSKYEVNKGATAGKSMPQGKCVAGIRLQRASNNVIRRNTFVDIENLPSSQTAARKYGPALLHAIYISDSSSQNRVEDNVFRRFTGSPVRVRASSNDTLVKGNTFEGPLYPLKTGQKYTLTAVSQWYCNEAVDVCRSRAKEGAGECPSTGLEITGNRVGPGIELYADESQSKVATCPIKTMPESQRQPRLKDNVSSR